jgi:hypothetical protein
VGAAAAADPSPFSPARAAFLARWRASAAVLSTARLQALTLGCLQRLHQAGSFVDEPRAAAAVRNGEVGASDGGAGAPTAIVDEVPLPLPSRKQLADPDFRADLLDKLCRVARTSRCFPAPAPSPLLPRPRAPARVLESRACDPGQSVVFAWDAPADLLELWAEARAEGGEVGAAGGVRVSVSSVATDAELNGPGLSGTWLQWREVLQGLWRQRPARVLYLCATWLWPSARLPPAFAAHLVTALADLSRQGQCVRPAPLGAWALGLLARPGDPAHLLALRGLLADASQGALTDYRALTSPADTGGTLQTAPTLAGHRHSGPSAPEPFARSALPAWAADPARTSAEAALAFLCGPALCLSPAVHLKFREACRPRSAPDAKQSGGNGPISGPPPLLPRSGSVSTLPHEARLAREDAAVRGVCGCVRLAPAALRSYDNAVGNPDGAVSNERMAMAHELTEADCGRSVIRVIRVVMVIC